MDLWQIVVGVLVLLGGTLMGYLIKGKKIIAAAKRFQQTNIKP